jgi:hypothetical protein
MAATITRIGSPLVADHCNHGTAVVETPDVDTRPFNRQEHTMANLLSYAANAALNAIGVRTEEQPPHDIVTTLSDGIEVRRYRARLVAETVVEGRPGTDGRDEAFRRLAGYIFGKNRARQSIAMTAPVETDRGRAIAMTAPVESIARGAAIAMRFFLPANLTLDTAPAPADERVRIVEVPPALYAVLRFSGVAGPDIVQSRAGELMRAVAGSRFEAKAAPVTWFYDPPFTVPFLRRNEVAVEIAPRQTDTTTRT